MSLTDLKLDDDQEKLNDGTTITRENFKETHKEGENSTSTESTMAHNEDHDRKQHEEQVQFTSDAHSMPEK